ncbi:hypothetical protein ACKKBG_A13170 [Auxenochlorella protothecoides x Auxenochlorella symbiontica]
MASSGEGLEGLGITALDVDEVQAALLNQAPGSMMDNEDDSVDQETLLARYKDAARELQAIQSMVSSQAPEGLQASLMRQRQEGLQAALDRAGCELEAAGLPRPRVGDAGAPTSIQSEREGLPKTQAVPGQARSSAKGKAAAEELVEDDLFSEGEGKGSSGALVETDRDRLIRLGVLTPFDNVNGFERRVMHSKAGPSGRASPEEEPGSEAAQRMAARLASIKAARHTTRLLDAQDLPQQERPTKRVDEGYWRQGNSEYVQPVKRRRRPRLRKLRGPREESASSGEDVGGERDDADEANFDARQAARARRRDRGVAEEGGSGSEAEPEEDALVEFEGGFRISAGIYDRLFEYQRTGVKWLWELHTHRTGGILGDEMGLGKTVQIGAFLAGLLASGLYRPSLIVCPATVLRQWLRELRAWAPDLRVGIMHGLAGGARGAQALVSELAGSAAGLLLTTYEHMRLQRELLLSVDWGYVILDEGHKIRNPDAEVTLTAKQMPTVHRLILTGAPIQNRLTELWSLFDFVFPGKLGTLPVFQAQFGLPIQIGGYANASALQVSTAYKCAVVLRDVVGPYLLRRRKADVDVALPPKTEQVLFCMLTPVQRDLYKAYLASKDLKDIFAGHRAALAGIDILRKICNHPDLLDRARWEASEDYGNQERSGKLVVLARVLKHWHAQGHKALVFTQTQQMLDIVEKTVNTEGYRYHRMDGATAVSQRALLMDDFNDNPNVFLFLLTTRVGGLGVNLTGANRIVVFDPDWNFSTDVQARERAWRIGQTRDVTVYRFVTSGTIEEKIYHRQVYKQFLSDKVLRDPRQRRFFKARDMHDLFTLGGEYQDGTETSAIFGDAGFLHHHPGPDAVEGGAGGDAAGVADGGDGLEAHARGRSPDAAATAAGGAAGDAAGALGLVTAAAPSAAPAAPTPGGDTGILRDLFEGTGLHSALDHSAIEHANDPGTLEVEREAGRVARAAAAALRASRAELAANPISQPTWTGRSGAAPRFGRAVAGLGTAPPGPGLPRDAALRPGGGAPHSSELLARMRARARGEGAGAAAGLGAGAAAEGAAGTARGGGPGAGRPGTPTSTGQSNPATLASGPQRLASAVVQFLEGLGGSAPSAALVEHFQETLPAAQLPLFRGVLKSVATLRRRDGAKLWVLKPEFSGAS